MHDSRLVGRWRSDATATRNELRARVDIPARSRRMLSALMGKLELRFTKSRCYSTLNGSTTVIPYQVVAKDADSVVIVSGGRITQVHFERKGFWILVGSGRFREFFREILR